MQRRSDPRRRFEPSGSAKPTRRAEAEARGESDRGGDRQGRGTRLRSPCRKTPEEATRERAGGAGGTQAHRESGRAPLYLPAGKKADKGSEGETALRAVLARDQRRGRPERLARIPLHWFLQDRKREAFEGGKNATARLFRLRSEKRALSKISRKAVNLRLLTLSSLLKALAWA